MNDSDAAVICKALGDPNRIKIIGILSVGESCACRLLEKFDITQPTLSHHMKILCGCGLVKARSAGKWNYYSLDRDRFRDFGTYITALACFGETEAEKCD